ncbi:NADH:flavin oxidoreductase/NADH oxidase [Halomicroarcula limicola]|uniref:NADH:flavin oxidoreductase/NADH oxidase n=1 Tax=Haloarcula limicola TaxID=1429915 RepID=A0A8J8C5B6_9EURY|nr:NADH:flavin oxidoreductase/NADH oxidase [Halomicroarcula limicola]MBV0925049.1 NADH:flavin oxidoreductase/NADH oxidase [Halomicroarcula limicola]
MTALFSPLDLRETTIPNRIMVSPMCQYSCEDRDGLATAWHRTHLGSRAVGGAGLVMAEATAVEPRGRITPEDLGIWSDEHAAALEPIAEFVREQGSVPAIQLAHAGRKASTSRPWEGHDPLGPDEGGWDVVAPSDDPWPYEGGEAPTTEKLDQDGIESVIDSFRAAAERALDAGFEVAEVHAAHGYLLHEFCSPVTNHREDDYGGDFEGRTRLAREVTAAIRDVWPDDKPVFVRISATDWLPDRESWTVEDSVRLADDLHEVGADLIDVSGGAITPDSTPPYAGPNYQLEYAEQIREETDSDIGVGTVGGITTAQQAEAIVGNDRADLTVVGREHLRDPYFALHAADELGAEVEPPIQYHRAF